MLALPKPSISLKYQPFRSTGIDNQTLSIGYDIYYPGQVVDVSVAKSFFEANLPPMMGSLYLHNTRVAHSGNEEKWDGEADYTCARPLYQSTYSIEIGTGSSRFTNSLMTVGGYAPSGVPVLNFQGAIGVTKDGIEGADVFVPSMVWNERHMLPDSMITPAYIQMLYYAVARMNDAPFRMFQQGEALFIGVTMTESTEIPAWECNFRWLGSPNASNFGVGPINIAAKYGHDYLWVLYKDAMSNGSAVKIPYNAFVERVYQFTSMDQFYLDDPR